MATEVRVRPSRRLGWSVRLLVVAIAMTVAWPGRGIAAPAPAVSCVDAQARASAAMVTARTCHKQVEIASARTESAQLFALPSGRYSLQVSAQPQRVHRADGTWAAADAALARNADGSWSPAAGAVDVRVSDGGAGPFVTVGSAGRSVGLSWPHALPAPTVSGATATYAEVLPDVDLQVTASVTGFSELLVVKSAVAAANPVLAAVSFGVTSSGLTLSSDALTGALAARDSAGDVVFSSGTPRMWDSTGTTADPRTRSRSERAAGHVDARQAPLGTSVSARSVTLTPSTKFLADPATVFPVYIDPTLTSGNGGASGMTWTQVYQTYPTTSYWMDGDAEGLKVGYAEDSGYRNRALWSVPLPSVLAGATVSSATFSVDERYAWTCTKEPVDLWLTGGISSSTTWNNQPSWMSKISEINTGYGYSSSCPAQTVGWPATSAVQTGIDSGWSALTLGLRTPNESLTNPSNWHKYVANSAKLVIVYDHAPAAPSLNQLGMGAQGQTVCGVSAGSPTHVNTTNGLVLNATLTDPDASAGDLVMAAWSVTGIASQYVPAAETAGLTSGSVHRTTIAAAAFTDGMAISWQVRGVDTDSNMQGAQSAPCYFVVDNTAPSPPELNSTDLALRIGLGIVPGAAPSAVVGKPAAVTFAPDPADVDRVVGYQYGVAADAEPAVSIWLPAGADGSAVASIVPLAASSFTELTVVAVKSDGTAGTPTLARFRANAAATATHVPRDATGDGRADVTTLINVGNGKSALWRWNANSAANLMGAPLAPQGVAGIYPNGSVATAEGDFDGDGLSDVAALTQSGANVLLTVQRSDGNQLLGTPTLATFAGWSRSSLRIVAGDFNGDGVADIGVMYTTTSSTWEMRVLLSTSSPGAVSFAPVANWHTNTGSDWTKISFVAGDFTGDGKADVVEFVDAGTAQTTMYLHTSTGSSFPVGSKVWDSGAGNLTWSSSKPFAGDFNGDGRADVAVRYEQDANCRTTLLVDYSTTAGIGAAFTTVWDSGLASWCANQTEPIAADFTGDGRADIALVYHCCGAFQAKLYTLTSNGTSFAGAVSRFEGNLGPVGTGSLLVDTTATTKYELVNVNSGKCVTVPGAATGDAVQLVQQTCAGVLNQLFTIDRIGPGFEWFHMTHTPGKCIDYWSNTDGQPIWQYTCNTVGNGAAEYLELDYVTGFGSAVVAKIFNHATGKCMDVENSSLVDGAAVRGWSCTGAANQQYRLQPISAGPGQVAWYQMGESGGSTLADSSGRGATASLASGAGVGGGRATFNGSTGYAATSGPLLRTDGSFTASAWVRPTAANKYSAVLGQDALVCGGFWLEVNGGNHWTFDMYSADASSPTVYSATTFATVVTNTWQHVAAVYDAPSGVMTLYVNGVSAGTASHPGAFNATGSFVIGRARYNNADNNYWTGDIDDVRVWDRALSASEISTVFGSHA